MRPSPRVLSLLVLAAGALVPLAGVLPAPGSTLVGTELTDSFKHAWSFWHTVAVLRDGSWPWTSYMNGPTGGLLIDPMLLPATLVAPITLVLGPVAAANAWVWISFLAIGVATAALAHRLTGSLAGATVAGLVAQTAPYVLGYPFASGVWERLAVWVFPAVLLALLARRDGGRWPWTLLGAGALFVAALGCPVYGVFAAALGVLSVPLLLRPADGAGVKAAVRRLAVPVLACGLALALAFGTTGKLTDSPDGLVPQPARTDMVLGVADLPREEATVSALFDPRDGKLVARSLTDQLEPLAYIGAFPLLLALLGAVLARARDVIGVVILGALGPLLALGPQLGPVPDPLFYLLGYTVPVYGNTPPIWQQIAWTTPLLGVGLAALVGRFGLVAGGAALVATWGERLLVLPFPLVGPAASVDVPAAWESLDAPGPVAEIPRAWQGTSFTRDGMYLSQTVHQQPGPMTINLGTSWWDWYGPFLHGVAADWPAAVDCLQRGGYRWLGVHRGGYRDPRTAEHVVGQIRAVLGEARSDDGVLALFDLGAPGNAPPLPPLRTTVMELRRAGMFEYRLPADAETCPVDRKRPDELIGKKGPPIDAPGPRHPPPPR